MKGACFIFSFIHQVLNSCLECVSFNYWWSISLTVEHVTRNTALEGCRDIVIGISSCFEAWGIVNTCQLCSQSAVIDKVPAPPSSSPPSEQEETMVGDALWSSLQGWFSDAEVVGVSGTVNMKKEWQNWFQCDTDVQIVWKKTLKFCNWSIDIIQITLMSCNQKFKYFNLVFKYKKLIFFI